TTVGTQQPAEVALQVYCNDCRLTAFNFISTASSITSYSMLIVEHFIHCMGTASTFMEGAECTATTAGTLHPAEVALQAH
ncbi:hypothetical protein, partial [Clostridioides difficile]|uniref:hypothetical protein n=1 Tax=Clostridioides difficile TaxID=1496 RepID=UPI001A9A4CF9